MSKEFINTYYKVLEIIQHIKNENTGTPEEFRKNLSLSKKQLYNYLNILGNFNCFVKYSRKRNTYYFTNNCKFKHLNNKS